MSDQDETTQETPIQTDAESQEFGALHGQNAEGEETGSSGAMTATGEDVPPDEDDRSGEGTGAAAGEYS